VLRGLFSSRRRIRVQLSDVRVHVLHRFAPFAYARCNCSTVGKRITASGTVSKNAADAASNNWRPIGTVGGARYTSGTEFYLATGDVYATQQLLGHADVSATANI
jgi:site-specific recombinase XerC